jgi:hypothetical protein
MRALCRHVVARQNAPFNMPSHLVEPLEVVLRNREALVYSDLHYAGALFNVYLIQDMESRDDQVASLHCAEDPCTGGVLLFLYAELE